MEDRRSSAVAAEEAAEAVWPEDPPPAPLKAGSTEDVLLKGLLWLLLPDPAPAGWRPAAVAACCCCCCCCCNSVACWAWRWSCCCCCCCCSVAVAFRGEVLLLPPERPLEALLLLALVMLLTMDERVAADQRPDSRLPLEAEVTGPPRASPPVGGSRTMAATPPPARCVVVGADRAFA